MTTLEWIPWIAAWVMFGAFTVEAVLSKLVLRDRHYDVRDTLTSVAIAVGYVLARLAIGAVVTGILLAIWHATPLRWSMDSWLDWLVLFLAEDFLYYWSHRASHTLRFMWASHAVHHNSPHLNLSTGLRNSWIGGAIDWVFLVPPVALGFHPLALAAVIAVASAWDFLTHTPYVGKLPVIDFVFNSPSNHRVHHGRDRVYVDKNLGGALIIWDRMFGTYAAEARTPVYGVDRAPARPFNPFYLQLYLWAELLRDLTDRPRTASGPPQGRS